jgi:uncharacterized protein YcbK (DUF882 family)
MPEGDRVLRQPTAPLSIGLVFGLAISFLIAVVGILPAPSALSREPDKTLKLLFGHTGEKDEFTFKRNGNYDQGELRRLNHFLRDWRKGEDARMDPHLLDLVWAIYQQTGSHDYIHVVSAYRSPATNEMLRRRSSGVAKNSQHRLGKAMDWYLTDVPLAKLRATAMKMQGGGVGYYPRSGSPFVHTDTGNVRAWPRMSRQQLIALFPNGNTLHLPADGKPLPGYEQALARRKASGGTALAYLETDETETSSSPVTDRIGTADAASSNGWLRRIFPASKPSQNVADSMPATAPPAADQPQMADAAIDESAIPRPPRARPVAADALDDSAGETVVASLDPAETAPPLPQARPLLDGGSAATLGSAEDVIATLTERMSQESPTATSAPAAGSSADPAAPIALAFAAAAASPQPSEADRAILTAFATVKGSGAVRDADATLTAALTRRSGEGAPQPASLALAYAAGDVPPAPDIQPTAAAPPAPATEGIVIGPLEPVSYQTDEHELVNLIQPPEEAAPSTRDRRLAMPTPEGKFLVAPVAASEVADLRGQSGPPVERFSRSWAAAPQQMSFFTRLFASWSNRPRLGRVAKRRSQAGCRAAAPEASATAVSFAFGRRHGTAATRNNMPASLSTDPPLHCYQLRAWRANLSSGRYCVGAGRTLPAAGARCCAPTSLCRETCSANAGATCGFACSPMTS